MGKTILKIRLVIVGIILLIPVFVSAADLPQNLQLPAEVLEPNNNPPRWQEIPSTSETSKDERPVDQTQIYESRAAWPWAVYFFFLAILAIAVIFLYRNRLRSIWRKIFHSQETPHE